MSPYRHETCTLRPSSTTKEDSVSSVVESAVDAANNVGALDTCLRARVVALRLSFRIRIGIMMRISPSV